MLNTAEYTSVALLPPAFQGLRNTLLGKAAELQNNLHDKGARLRRKGYQTAAGLIIAGGVLLSSCMGGRGAVNNNTGTGGEPVASEPTAEPQETCTVMGLMKEGTLIWDKMDLPVLSDNVTAEFFPGSYFIDATASDNNERFASMLNDLNYALSAETGGYFGLTYEGLFRLAEDDFPYTFPGEEIAVVNTETLRSIVQFLECVQGKEEGAIYVTRNENVLPTPVPEEGLWKYLKDLFGYRHGLDPRVMALSVATPVRSSGKKEKARLAKAKKNRTRRRPH